MIFGVFVAMATDSQKSATYARTRVSTEDIVARRSRISARGASNGLK